MIAQEAKYHLQCLVSLYNKAAALQTERDDKQSIIDKVSHGIPLAELVPYINEARMDEDVVPVFKLTDLVKLYSSQLEHLGVEQHACLHSTELKNRILAQISELTEDVIYSLLLTKTWGLLFVGSVVAIMTVKRFV